MKYLSIVFLFLCACIPSVAQTNFYVRPDGGTPFTVDAPNGQCDGKHDAPYSGQGVNQPCAFSEVAYLAFDGVYTISPKWVIKGGDIVHISAGQFRLGYRGPNAQDHDGLAIAGNPYNSGLPNVPSGTAAHPTQFIGAGSGKTQLFGGYALGSIFGLEGSSFVTIQGIELTDHAQCSRIGNGPQCVSSYPLDDYAQNGITTSKATHDVSLIDLNIHGFTGNAVAGSVGGLITVDHVRMAFNGSAGWEFDDGSTSTADAQISATYLTIEWNGCNEEYPIAHKFPVALCLDQDNAGYGDGVGTPNTPLNFTCDHCTFRYNTQDGLDLLHTYGSIIKVTNSTSYGNMGQQWKFGAMKSVIFQNNTTIHNCSRMSAPMDGAPVDYNKGLSLFCRAAGDGIALAINDDGTYLFQNNSFIGYGDTSYDISCSGVCTKPTITFENNLNIGYRNPNPNDGQLPGVFYWTGDGTHNLDSPFLKIDHNIYFNMRSLPADGVGTDPRILNEPIWNGEASLDAVDFHLTSSSVNAIGTGAPVNIPTDFDGVARLASTSVGAFETLQSGDPAPLVDPPPVTDPPVTDPPATDPPVTTPPVVTPPVTDPTSSSGGVGSVMWIKVASENDTVTLPSYATYRYGVGSAWTKSFTTPGSAVTLTANNATFGDVAYGSTKELDVLATISQPPVEVPPTPSTSANCTVTITTGSTPGVSANCVAK